jgi:hypothetical protein
VFHQPSKGLLMINKVIRGFTRILGKPASWDPKTHGECGALAILDHQHEATPGNFMPSMISAWDITPDEMVRLRQGAPIYLRVAGEAHPPVCIWVGFPSLDPSVPAENEVAFDELEDFRQAVKQRIRTILETDPDGDGHAATSIVERLAKFVVDARLGGRADETS